MPLKKTIRGKDQKNLLLDNLCFLLRQKYPFKKKSLTAREAWKFKGILILILGAGNDVEVPSDRG